MRLIDLKSRHDSLDIIIVGGAEAWEIADAIAAANIRVILDPLQNLPSAFESAGSRLDNICLLYTSPSPRDKRQSRMPSSA